MGTLASMALSFLGKNWFPMLLLLVIGGLSVAYKVKAVELTNANLKVASLTQQVTALNATAANLQAQIITLGAAIKLRDNAVAQLKADSDAKQAQMNTLAKNLQDLTIKQAATVKALEAASAPENDASVLTLLQDSIQGVITWQTTLNTSQ